MYMSGRVYKDLNKSVFFCLPKKQRLHIMPCRIEDLNMREERTKSERRKLDFPQGKAQERECLTCLRFVSVIMMYRNMYICLLH